MTDIIPNSWIVKLSNNITKAHFDVHRQWAFATQRAQMNTTGHVSPTDIIGNTYTGKQIGYAGIFDDATIEEIRSHKDVAYVEPDRVMVTCAQEFITQSPIPSWGLGSISHKSGRGQDYVFSDKLAGGDDVFVYVIDTGVMISHEEFDQDRASIGFNTTKFGDSDVNGHGTHVAGIIAGKTCGIAKSAKIISVKVYGDDGSCSSSDTAAAVNWVIQDVLQNNRSGRAVVNMSLTTRDGGNVFFLNNLINQGTAEGIVFVVAAGNHNRTSAGSPASAHSCITVGATEYLNLEGGSGETRRCSSSNYGAALDIFAPGTGITSCGIKDNNNLVAMTGTSVAAPHVAGVIAYLIAGEKVTTPAKMIAQLLAIAIPDLIKGLDNLSPNLYLYNGSGA